MSKLKRKSIFSVKYRTMFLFFLAILGIEAGIMMISYDSFLLPKLLQQLLGIDRKSNNRFLVPGLLRQDVVLGVHQKSSNRSIEPMVHIAFTSCGVRKDQSFVLVKSALLLTNTTVMFHIFTDNITRPEFVIQLNQMKNATGANFDFKLYDVEYPDKYKNFSKLFAQCSSLRLFYPLPDHSPIIEEKTRMPTEKAFCANRVNRMTLLPTLDAVLYVDTDTLFLAPPEEVWSLFQNFNASHLAGLAPESTGMDVTNSWYETQKETPHYGAKGLNSGVMLMNLTRIRATSWIDDLAKIWQDYIEGLKLGDQGLLNIYFHFKPELLMLCPCETNYRSDYCGGPVLRCEQAAKILHGNRRVWYGPIIPTFKGIYKAFEKDKDDDLKGTRQVILKGPHSLKEFQLGDPREALPKIVEANINRYRARCGRIGHLVVEALYKQLT